MNRRPDTSTWYIALICGALLHIAPLRAADEPRRFTLDEKAPWKYLIEGDGKAARRCTVDDNGWLVMDVELTPQSPKVLLQLSVVQATGAEATDQLFIDAFDVKLNVPAGLPGPHSARSGWSLYWKRADAAETWREVGWENIDGQGTLDQSVPPAATKEAVRAVGLYVCLNDKAAGHSFKGKIKVKIEKLILRVGEAPKGPNK